MSQIGGWMDRSGGLRGEDLGALCRALAWNGAGWREAYCTRAFGLLAVAERGSEPRPLYRSSESGNLILFYDGAVVGGGEAILCAYGRRNTASFADSLEGSFSLALLDEERGELILARSRDGDTPFYYAENTNRLLFSSQIKGVLSLLPDACGVKRDRLRQFLNLSFDKRSPEMLYEGIRPFPAGQTLICNRLGYVRVAHGQRRGHERRERLREPTEIPKSREEMLRLLYGEMMKSDAPMLRFPFCGVKERREGELLLWHLLEEEREEALSDLCGEDFRLRIHRERGGSRLDFMANLYQAQLLLRR